MQNIDEQEVLIKFCFSNEKTAEETHKMLRNVYGDNTKPLSTIHERYVALEEEKKKAEQKNFHSSE